MIGFVHVKIGHIKMRVVHTRPWAFVRHKLSIFIEISFFTHAEFPCPHFFHLFFDLGVCFIEVVRVRSRPFPVFLLHLDPFNVSIFHEFGIDFDIGSCFPIFSLIPGVC